MKSVDARIWVTTILVCGCYVLTAWVHSGYTFDVIPLSQNLGSLPLELSGWHGEDLPLDDRVREILNADQVMNRVYQNHDGVAVTASLSAWLRPESVSEVAPHVPKVCYTNSGWKIEAERDVRVKSPHGDFSLTALLCERKGERIVVCYWYQMGDSYFNSEAEARQIHRKLWGKRNWPATVKYLLQTNATSIESGLPQLEQFGLLLQQQMSSTAMKSP